MSGHVQEQMFKVKQHNSVHGAVRKQWFSHIASGSENLEKSSRKKFKLPNKTTYDIKFDPITLLLGLWRSVFLNTKIHMPKDIHRSDIYNFKLLNTIQNIIGEYLNKNTVWSYTHTINKCEKE